MQNEQQLVSLTGLTRHYNASEHPSVKAGDMAPSAARDKLLYQFGQCSQDHQGHITMDEFITYHEMVADEAHSTRAGDVDGFIEDLIMRLWRLGGLLQPTYVRPAFPVTEMPKALYGKTLMSLIWPGKDEDGSTFLYCVKDVVQPIFRRGDLPDALQGFFAFPCEYEGYRVKKISAQISVQRWLDVVWEYEENKFAAIEGILSACVEKSTLPPYLQVLIQEHHDVQKLPQCTFLETRVTANPMYRKTSETYGYRVKEECRKIHNWKCRSLEGLQCGLQYHGLVGNFFSKNGPAPSNSATGINM